MRETPIPETQSTKPTVREQLVEALELQDLAEFLADPRHDPREAIRRLEARGDYETGWLDRREDATELYLSMAKEARRLALARARAEPEERLYPERAVAPMREIVTKLLKTDEVMEAAAQDCRDALDALDALGFPPKELGGCKSAGYLLPCDSSCPCYEAGLEAQRERVGGGTA